MKIKGIILGTAFLAIASLRTTNGVILNPVAVQWESSTRSEVQFTIRGYFGEEPPLNSYPSNGTLENGFHFSPNGLWQLYGLAFDFNLNEAVGGYTLSLGFLGSLPKENQGGFRLNSPTFGGSFEPDWAEGEAFEAFGESFGGDFISAWRGTTTMTLITSESYPPPGEKPWIIEEPFTIEWRIEGYASGPRLPSRVPDGGATVALLGLSFGGMVLGRKIKKKEQFPEKG